MVDKNTQPEGDNARRTLHQKQTDAGEKIGHKARNELSEELDSGKLNEQEQKILQHKRGTGKSSVTGFGKKIDGSGGLASAESLFGSSREQAALRVAWRDAELKKTGQDPGGIHENTQKQTEEPGKTKAPIVDDGYNQRLERWQRRSENYFRDEAQQLKDVMHTYSLSDLFSNRCTAIADVYEHSRLLTDGSSGKSPTLEDAVERLKNCPWADKIRIRLDGSVKNPEYNERASTITLNPNDSVAKQIETFVHEAYHATHQGLNDLYGGNQPVFKVDFIRIMADHEIMAFESEIRVHDELSSGLPGASPVSYEWKDRNDIAQPTKDLGQLYHSKGMSGLYDFVIDEARTRMVINGHPQLATYREYYEAHYVEYRTSFPAAHKQYQDWFAKDPSVQRKIQQNRF